MVEDAIHTRRRYVASGRVGNRWNGRLSLAGAIIVALTLQQGIGVAPTVGAAFDTLGSVIPDTVTTADSAGVTTPDSAAAIDTSLAVPPPGPPPVQFRYSVFDSVLHSEYLFRHSYTLDNFLEFEPGFILGRYGPIGKSTVLSRYSFGRGRCRLYLNDTPVNDPQNDVAPLPQLPVSGLGVLLESAAVDDVYPPDGGLEGRMRIVEAAPAPSEPTTFLELSKSTRRNLRQRRLWFASMNDKMGLEFGYDEILNDGYSFDGRQLESDDFLNGADYGSTHSRFLTVNFRGQLPGGDKYKFSLRRFVSDSIGDLHTADAEQRLAGHLANVSAEIGEVRLNLFSRSYDAADRPSATAALDSNTVNLTGAAYLNWRLSQSPRRSLTLGGGFENIQSKQDVGGAESYDTVRKSSAWFTAVSTLGGGVTTRLHLSAENYAELTTGFGGSFSAMRGFGRNVVDLYVSRAYRMPNLGELFLPAHPGGTVDTVIISGNQDVDDEFGWEVGGRITTHVGPLTNELRFLALRVHRPIDFLPTKVNGEDWLLAQNGDRQAAGVVEDRIRLDTMLKSFELDMTGSVAWTGGERTGYFQTAPRWDAHASLRFGRSIFQATSALYVGLDYTYRGNRKTVSGGGLPSYNLLNLKLDGRLLKAQLYFMVMNALDEKYQTIEGYLMTPRTFVYGIAWQLFD
jgi:hypothetical protein